MKNNYLIPASIVLFGVIVGGCLLMISQGGGAPIVSNMLSGTKVRPVDATDHIMGNPNARLKIVEYADVECPYCSLFETTMIQIMQYYGSTGDVAWVFRNFPLITIHKQASAEAAAAECASEQQGSNGFFKLLSKMYENTPGEDGMDLTKIPTYADQVGLDGKKLKSCMDAGTYTSKVIYQYKEAVSTGAQGTPHIVFMLDGANMLTLEGNQPYSAMRTAIDQILKIDSTPTKN